MCVEISAVRVGGKDEKQLEAAHKSKMQEIAKLVAGNDKPPDWLRDVLSDFSFEVASSHSIEELLPTKAELWDALDSIEELSEKLLKRLRIPMIAGFIAIGAGKTDESYIDGVVRLISTIANDARQAKKSPRLATPDGKLLRGAGRPHLPGGMPPKYVCAAIIAEVCSFFHQNQEPTPYIGDVQVAVARYFGAWFPSKGWGSNELKGWTMYLESIGHPDLEALRKEVRRHLDIRAGFEAVLRLENNAV